MYAESVADQQIPILAVYLGLEDPEEQFAGRQGTINSGRTPTWMEIPASVATTTVARSRHRIHCMLYPQKPDRTILRSMRYYARRHGYVCKDTTNRCIYMYIDIRIQILYALARARIALYFALGERTSGACIPLTSPSPTRAAEIRVCINLKLVSIWRGRCARRVSERRTAYVPLRAAMRRRGTSAPGNELSNIRR